MLEFQTASEVMIGAGPAGLTAAYELTRLGFKPVVLEASNYVGGISRTEAYKGYLFDIGGHRFYTKVAEIERLWHDLLGAEFRETNRLSRIYYEGQFYKYPLELFDALPKIGIVESIRILLSYLYARLWPHPRETTLEEWITNRFGRRLFERFFRTYTEKVWGMPCNKIGADWAAQRIQGLSLQKAILNALTGAGKTEIKTLIHKFEYPRRGPGMMWEKFEAAVQEQGGQVLRRVSVQKILVEGTHVHTLEVQHADKVECLPVLHVISSMPLATLIASIVPAPPQEVCEAAARLRYRDFLMVGLIINRAEIFPDNWLYIHSPTVKVGRIQNFKNWSADMVPDSQMTSLGMEYFCNQGDTLWSMDDAQLIKLATQELQTLGLGRAAEVQDGVVIRQLTAYPFYDMNYQQSLAVIRGYLSQFDNLQTVGRNGLHRYNNQDHSMLTGLLAARNIAGDKHDVWSVNTERSYYETFLKEDQDQ